MMYTTNVNTSLVQKKKTPLYHNEKYHARCKHSHSTVHSTNNLYNINNTEWSRQRPNKLFVNTEAKQFYVQTAVRGLLVLTVNIQCISLNSM